ALGIAGAVEVAGDAGLTGIRAGVGGAVCGRDVGYRRLVVVTGGAVSEQDDMVGFALVVHVHRRDVTVVLDDGQRRSALHLPVADPVHFTCRDALSIEPLLESLLAILVVPVIAGTALAALTPAQ